MGLYLVCLIVGLGWILLILLALILGLRALWRKPHKKSRFITPAILLVLALAWFMAVDVPGIVWRNYSKIQTSDGSTTAWVHITFGLVAEGKYVYFRHGQKLWHFRLGNFEQPDPVRIFWLPGEKSIGVDYASDACDIDHKPVSDAVLDVFPIPKEMSEWTNEDFSSEDLMKDSRQWNFNGRKRLPTPEEQKYFDK